MRPEYRQPEEILISELGSDIRQLAEARRLEKPMDGNVSEDILERAFYWSETIEGHNYWRQVYINMGGDPLRHSDEEEDGNTFIIDGFTPENSNLGEDDQIIK